MNFRASKWLVALPLLIAAACGRQPAQLTELEKHNVSKLTENLTTHCVGRYLIDMPPDVLVTGDATVLGVQIESQEMSHEAYLREVANRKAELRRMKSIDAYPYLYADDVVDGPDTHYFIYRGNLSDGPANRVFEAYKWDHGYRFKFGIEGHDYFHPDQTYKPYIQDMSVKNDVPEKTSRVFDLVKRLRWRAEDEIPSEPGLCFPTAFLPGKAGEKEVAGTQFVLGGNRDVSIGIESNSGIRESNTLLQRGEEINRDLKSIGGRTIRKGIVALQGINAEEWLFTGKTDSGVQGTKCLLEANSMTSSAQSPLLTLDLDAGSTNAFMQDRITAASMSEGEAIALWDVVSRTLRPRPNAF
ncbi:T6SS immunity protein Tli4 family protein [Burkholderia glumae]|uniref:T6SS immunity protein Tli4 family protein n=2 Tax=Burkholderia glumae TaxID=337 RepID=UPI0013741471|nr:T6SS immunity protein Tli4 family protein [Burkholderia glumae]MCR1769728.1 hypothetical protein [Burkholderia glumae]QHP93646.1 hypothetical protein EXE55_22455 [Burkholderia glumae]QKM51339.1 hypothetical protein B7760_05405 [Burkholderia glumae]